MFSNLSHDTQKPSISPPPPKKKVNFGISRELNWGRLALKACTHTFALPDYPSVEPINPCADDSFTNQLLINLLTDLDSKG